MTTTMKAATARAAETLLPQARRLDLARARAELLEAELEQMAARIGQARPHDAVLQDAVRRYALALRLAVLDVTIAE